MCLSGYMPIIAGICIVVGLAVSSMYSDWQIDGTVEKVSIRYNVGFLYSDWYR